MNEKYGKTFLGTSDQPPIGVGSSPKVKRGWSLWIEWGKWYSAPKVNGKKFRGHDYDNGGYENGIRNCKCGCYMGESNSSGPVDPFGPCPENPKTNTTL